MAGPRLFDRDPNTLPLIPEDLKKEFADFRQRKATTSFLFGGLCIASFLTTIKDILIENEEGVAKLTLVTGASLFLATWTYWESQYDYGMIWDKLDSTNREKAVALNRDELEAILTPRLR